MPTVPVVDQTASTAPQYAAPGVAPVRNAAPQQQEAMGQATQQAGELAMKTGSTIGDRLVEQVDDATVKSAESSALSQTNSILYDPQNGYLNQRGKNAIDQYEPTKQAVVKAFQDQLEGLNNPIQKHMFQQVMNQHLLTTGQRISTHNYDQTSQYSGEAAVSRANTFATSASNASASYGQTDEDGNPTGEFSKNLATAEQETLHAVGIMKGAPADSDVAKEALLNLHTQIGTGAISQMMDSRAPYSKVQAVYDDMREKGMLTLRAQDTLGKMVKAYTEQESTRATVNQSLSDAYRASQGQPTTSTGTPDYQFPMKGATVTSNPYNAEEGAVAVNAPAGSNIQAPADGKVKQVGKDADDNFTMQIQHPDGSVTSFSGLNASNVKVGDSVQRGEVLAISGEPTVSWSLADKNGNAVDPTKAGLAPVDLTKVTDEKVLGDALVSMRKQVTAPYLQQQATSEMESIVRHNQQMQNVQATQTFKQASDAFYNGGMNWQSIPTSVFNQLTGEQRQHFKDEQTNHVLQQYNQGQAFKTMSETDLVSDFIANPDQITTDNVEAARSQLSRSTYLSLMEKAQTLGQNPKGVYEAQAVNERIKYYAGQAGVNVNPKLPADKQTLTDLTFKVQSDIDEIKAQNKGKATADQVNKAIQNELIRRTVNTGPSALFNWTGFGSPNNSAQKYLFQIPGKGQSTPTVGDTRKFPNGTTGKWDGKGWVAQ